MRTSLAEKSKKGNNERNRKQLTLKKEAGVRMTKEGRGQFRFARPSLNNGFRCSLNIEQEAVSTHLRNQGKVTYNSHLSSKVLIQLVR